MRTLLFLTLALLVLPATAMAASAPTTLTIDVVSARSLGCSPDTFTAPDLRVTVFVNGQQLLQTVEASDNAAPEWGAVGTIRVNLPATIGIEVQEGEPGGFFGLGESWIQCTTAPGGATRATFTYDGPDTMRYDTQGDDSKAAEAVVVVGADAPSAAQPVALVGVNDAQLNWSVDARAVGDRVMRGSVGAQIANVGLAGSYHWTGLCDNTAYSYRILTDDEPWHVSSADQTFTTVNAAPDPARVLEAWVSDKNLSVQWEWGAHDAARFDVLGGPDADHATSVRASWSPPFQPAPFHQETVVFARVATDAVVRVKLTDTGGLASLSDAFQIGAANQTATFPSPRDSCGAGASGTTTSSSPSAQPGPSPQPTPPPCCAPPPTFPGDNDTNDFTFGAQSDVTLEPEARLASVNVTATSLNQMRLEEVRVNATLDASFEPQRIVPGLLLMPGQTGTSSFPLQIRENATVGVHLVRFDATLGNRTRTAWTNVTITAPPKHVGPLVLDFHRLDVTTTPDDTTIAPGGAAHATVRVKNVGNETLIIHAQSLWFMDEARPTWNESAPGWSAELSGNEFLVAPGATRSLPLTVHAADDASEGDVVVFTFLIGWNGTQGPNVPEGGHLNLTVESAAAVSAGFHVSSAGVAAIGGASVGGAALGLGLLLRREKWRLLILGPFAALYTRLAAPQLLHHETRDLLHRMILQRPGIRYSELKRETALPTGALLHHLRALERGRLVVGRNDGGQKRYYPPGAPPLAEAPVTAAQQRVLDLLDGGPLSQGEIAARLGVTQQAANAHVKALERAGRVVLERDPGGATLVHRLVEVRVVE